VLCARSDRPSSGREGAEMGAAWRGKPDAFRKLRSHGVYDKLTTVAAIVFMITSLLLPFLNETGLIVIREKPAQKAAPAAPPEGPAPPQAPAPEPAK